MLLATKHLMTQVDAQKLGESDAEVTFVGRSNSGKSSLINALCQKKGMAHVSQVPGKTRTINVYEVKPYRWIVDLPGYGFAVGNIEETTALSSMIEGYLNSRGNLRMVFVIIDAVTGPTKLDILMIDCLKTNEYPLSFVVNKIDKVGASKLALRKKEIAAQLEIDAGDIFWVSSKKKIAIEPLQKKISNLLKV